MVNGDCWFSYFINNVYVKINEDNLICHSERSEGFNLEILRHFVPQNDNHRSLV